MRQRMPSYCFGTRVWRLGWESCLSCLVEHMLRDFVAVLSPSHERNAYVSAMLNTESSSGGEGGTEEDDAQVCACVCVCVCAQADE